MSSIHRLWPRSASCCVGNIRAPTCPSRRTRGLRPLCSAPTSLASEPRPRHGYLEFPDGARIDFELDDRGEAQTITFPPRTVDEVTVAVTDAYDEGGRAPISELSFSQAG